MTNEKEIVLFETEDKSILLPVGVKDETVWLNRNQMAELFDRVVKTMGKHINNALKEELDNQVMVAKFATVQNDALFNGGHKRIGDAILVALTIMIVQLRAEEKEKMVSVVMNLS